MHAATELDLLLNWEIYRLISSVSRNTLLCWTRWTVERNSACWAFVQKIDDIAKVFIQY